MNRVDLVVGRDKELEELRRALDAPGGLVLLAGEGGIGKTRLAREAARIAADEGRAVVWGRPEHLAAPGPYGLILDLVENLAARGDPQVRTEASALAAALSDHGGGDASGVRRAAARLRGLLSMTGRGPVAIAEDLHVADEASQAVLVHLARSAADDGHLLIGTYRSEDLAVAEELERFLGIVAREGLARTIEIPPLDRDASLALAAAVAGAAGPAEWIASSGEGVPFFICELADAFARTGSTEGIPDSIARAALARGKRLDAVPRYVVAAAALAAGPIDAAVLALVCDLDQGAVARSLADAVRAGLLEERDGKLVFRHALLREALVADTVSVEAEALHRKIAAAIEQVHAGELAAHSRALAHHWYQGRDRGRAFAYALEAGKRALGLAAAYEARTAYELAVACTDQPAPEALDGLGEVAIREDRLSDAEELFLRAAGLYRDDGRAVDAARATARAAWTRVAAGADAGADALLDAALALLSGEPDARHRAALLAQRGALYRVRDASEAARDLEEAVEIAARLGEHGVRAQALEALAWIEFRRRRLVEAVGRGEQACHEAVLDGGAETIGRTHNNHAVILGIGGEPARALDVVAFARERIERSFGGIGLTLLGLTEAILRWLLGQPNAAGHLVSRHRINWPHWGRADRLRVWSALHGGDRERAIGVVREAMETAGASAETLDTGVAADAAMCEAVLLVSDGDAAAAATARRIAAFARERCDEDDDRLEMLVTAGEALVLAGDRDEAARCLADADALLAEFDAPYFAARADELRAAAAAAGDDLDGARRARSSALERYLALGNLVDRARCLRMLAEQTAGDPGPAVESLKEARVLAADAGSVLEGSRIEAALRRFGVRPRAGRPRKGTAPSSGLSAREEEVAALVGVGAGNAEIAARLYLSERTVQDHVTHALRKLGLTGRAGLAAWAAKRGLV